MRVIVLEGYENPPEKSCSNQLFFIRSVFILI